MMSPNLPAQLNAEQAAEYAGYETARKFRLAVKRRVMPKPSDPDARPQLWSRFEIDVKLQPGTKQAQTDPGDNYFDKRLGLA